MAIPTPLPSPRPLLHVIFNGEVLQQTDEHHKRDLSTSIAYAHAVLTECITDPTNKVHQGGAQLVERPAMQTKAPSSFCYAKTNTRGTQSSVLIST
jgi:hypothetical protein